jgi:hypothetical protein
VSEVAVTSPTAQLAGTLDLDPVDVDTVHGVPVGTGRG